MIGALSFHLSPFPIVTMSWPGQESSVGSRTAIGEYIRSLPLPGDKPEPLSVKPTYLSRTRSLRCRFELEVSAALQAQLAHLCVSPLPLTPSPSPSRLLPSCESLSQSSLTTYCVPGCEDLTWTEGFLALLEMAFSWGRQL